MSQPDRAPDAPEEPPPLFTRRRLLASVVGAGVVTALASEADSEIGTGNDLGAGTDPSVLAINPGETYVVDGTETYRALVWADGGELKLEGELELV